MAAQWTRYNYMGRTLVDWNIEEFCGYEPITTYYTDFGIAEYFGADAIRETFKTAIECWQNNIKWLTEIVMVLNWKIWEHYHRGNNELAELYDELWKESQEVVFKNFSKDDEAMRYYFRTTD